MNILIIGKDSYIGNHIDEWLTRDGLNVRQLDVLTDEWMSYDYSPFDAIVHVAGIVHRPDCHDWGLYKKVNTDLPIEIATMAKAQGVKQYIYFSSMAVYGVGKALAPNITDENSKLGSDSMYGKSKLMAEEGLAKLQDDHFSVSFVRPPSVYGKGCKGNYISRFTAVARKLPVIPYAYNDVKQSFIYIDNLAEIVRIIIADNLHGAFCPQDDVAVSANELLETICDGIGKKYRSSKLLGMFVPLFKWLPIVKKAYGGMEYARSLSDIEGKNYVVVPFKEGMKRTVS